ncbi:MAG: hypothetical protein ACJAZO_000542 [Myxococcota bacterium]|jgi:uncharacterized protein (TIGR01777 family)
MPVFHKQSRWGASAEALWTWHNQRAGFDRLKPPWESLRIESWEDVETGANTQMAVRQFGIWWRWTSHIVEATPNAGFTDSQEGGPFKSWLHTHRFVDGDGGGMLDDRIEYTLPLGALGQFVAGRAIAKTIGRGFRFRHRRTREDMIRHTSAALSPLRIAVTGASGLVGNALCAFLQGGGHTVIRTTRRSPAPDGWVTFDPANGNIDTDALEGLDAVVHLAGESISQKWTSEAKKRIVSSRVDGTTALAKTLAGLTNPPKTWVSGSAIGFYGSRGQERLDETSEPGDGFLADTCTAWEAATAAAEESGIRVVHLRTGIVLTPEGGALKEQLTPFKMGVGGPIGGGDQWVSWITRDDLLGLILHAIATPELAGPLNGTSPNAVQQGMFAKTLGKVLRRPAFLPLPSFAIRTLFGEMGNNLVLQGQRVYPAVALDTGYTFHHPDLEDALRFVLGAD